MCFFLTSTFRERFSKFPRFTAWCSGAFLQLLRNQNFNRLACRCTPVTSGNDGVDAFITVEQADALMDWVEASGKNLTTIYATHGHGDHFFGIGALLDRFPNARAVATSDVVELREWISALDTIESLNPRAVIAGHKRPGKDDSPKIIEETRQ
jgi:glyoxylase-like metal-dependent hydrolase (beta-lactamase superfamily II)